jgi:hypothetical protein
VCSINLTTAEMAAWSTRVAAALPGATGTVSAPDANGLVTVQISWRPPARPAAEPDSVYMTRVVFSQ